MKKERKKEVKVLGVSCFLQYIKEDGGILKIGKN